MRPLPLVVLSLACFLASVAAEAQKQQPQFTPVIVELFHSEGCSSCPKVEQLVTQVQAKALEQKVPIYCLAYHVDYWDKLGWKDPFASPAFTQRQEAYVKALRLSGKTTPSVIANGHLQFQGPGFQVVTQLLSNEVITPPTTVIGITNVAVLAGKATVDLQVGGRTEGLELHVAVVEGGLVSVITAGENKGQTQRHECTVRALAAVPVTAGEMQQVVVALPKTLVPDQGRVIAWLQDPATMRIHGAHGRNLTERASPAEPPAPVP